MRITKETVEKIAHLARLEVSETEVEEMKEGLSKTLKWMEQLNEVDTEGVEPLTHMSSRVNVLRDDVAKNTISRENALKNAPKHTDSYFAVPTVVE